MLPFLGRGAGFPSNTMWPGPRPSSMPSFILIHPTVWPQYTNVTDRQTGQRSYSIGRTILQMVTQKLYAVVFNCYLEVMFPFNAVMLLDGREQGHLQHHLESTHLRLHQPPLLHKEFDKEPKICYFLTCVHR